MDQTDNTDASVLSIDQIVRRFAYEVECIFINDFNTLEECGIDSGEARFLLNALKKALLDQPDHDISLVRRCKNP